MRLYEFQKLEEYIDIQTPEFQQWFKGSKVVDEQGQPLMMFHGSMVDDAIESFHVMSHFGTSGSANDRLKDISAMSPRARSLQHTGNSPHVYPVYLNIKNPIQMTDLGEWDDGAVWLEIALMDQFKADMHNEFSNEQTKNGEWQIVDVAYQSDIDPWDWLKSKGVDGVYYTNKIEDKGKRSWMAFDGSQIKNAF